MNFTYFQNTTSSLPCDVLPTDVAFLVRPLLGCRYSQDSFLLVSPIWVPVPKRANSCARRSCKNCRCLEKRLKGRYIMCKNTWGQISVAILKKTPHAKHSAVVLSRTQKNIQTCKQTCDDSWLVASGHLSTPQWPLRSWAITSKGRWVGVWRSCQQFLPEIHSFPCLLGKSIGLLRLFSMKKKHETMKRRVKMKWNGEKKKLCTIKISQNITWHGSAGVRHPHLLLCQF